MMNFNLNTDEDELFHGNTDITNYLSRSVPRFQQQQPTFTSPMNQFQVHHIPSTESAFVTFQSFDTCLQNVNQRLSTFGFPSPLYFKREYLDDQDIKILNTLHLLLKQHQVDVDFRGELSDRMSRIKCDNENYQQNLRKMQSRFESTNRDLEVMKSKYRALQNQHAKEMKKIETERDTLQKEVKNMNQKQAQFEHKYQRIEREYDRLKERMTRLVNERATGPNAKNAPKIEIVNLLPNHNSNMNAQWKHGPARNEDNLYQNIVGAFTDERNELVSENIRLRESLKSLNGELNQLKHMVYSSQGVRDEDSVDILPGQFELPFDLVKEELEGEIRVKIEQVAEILQTAKSKRHSVQKDFERLSKIIDCGLDGSEAGEAVQLLANIQQKQDEYKRTLEEQMALLQYNLAQNERNEMGVMSMTPTGEESGYFKTPIQKIPQHPSFNSTAEHHAWVEHEQLDNERIELETLANKLSQQHQHPDSNRVMFDSDDENDGMSESHAHVSDDEEE